MKFLSVVVLLCFAAVNVMSDEAFTKDKMIEIANICKGDVGATDDDVAKTLKHEPATSKEEKCLRACIMQKFGLLNAEGKLDKDVALVIFKSIAKGDAAKEEFATEFAESCGAIEVNEDHCEAAEEYLVCMKQKADEKGISLKDRE